MESCPARAGEERKERKYSILKKKKRGFTAAAMSASLNVLTVIFCEPKGNVILLNSESLILPGASLTGFSPPIRSSVT